MPLARATKIIAALLIGLFLSVSHAALAQEPDEARKLNEQFDSTLQSRAIFRSNSASSAHVGNS